MLKRGIYFKNVSISVCKKGIFSCVYLDPIWCEVWVVYYILWLMSEPTVFKKHFVCLFSDALNIYIILSDTFQEVYIQLFTFIRLKTWTGFWSFDHPLTYRTLDGTLYLNLHHLFSQVAWTTHLLFSSSQRICTWKNQFYAKQTAD